MDNQLAVCCIHAHIPIQSRTCVKNLRFARGSQMHGHCSQAATLTLAFISEPRRAMHCCWFWLYIDGVAATQLGINLGCDFCVAIYASWSYFLLSPPFHCLVNMQFEIFVSPLHHHHHHRRHTPMLFFFLQYFLQPYLLSVGYHFLDLVKFWGSCFARGWMKPNCTCPWHNCDAHCWSRWSEALSVRPCFCWLSLQFVCGILSSGTIAHS